MRRLALEEAEKVLPQEMGMMLPRPMQMEVAAMCGLPPEAPAEELARALAEQLAGLAWSPLAGCRSSLRGAPEEDVRAKLQLFWRCAVALCMMPLAQLAALSARKRPFLADLEALLPPEDAQPAVARLAHLRLNLPVFAMVARLPDDADRPPAPAQQAQPPPQRPPSAEGAAPATPAAGEEPGPSAAPASGAAAHEPPAAAEGQGPASAAGGAALPDDDAALEGAVDAGGHWVPPAARKQLSAARHTYDVGYSKWEKFDVDAALREVDGPQLPRKHKVDVAAMQRAAEPVLSSDDPVEALGQAIKRLEGGQPPAAGAAPKAAASAPPPAPTPLTGEGKGKGERSRTLDAQYRKWDKLDEDAASEDERPAPLAAPKAAQAPPPAAAKAEAKAAAPAPAPALVARPAAAEPAPADVVVAGAADPTIGATAATLSKEYQKWNNFVENDGGMDDVDDGDDDEPDEHDLDAIKGPKEEVARIRAHWRREAKQRGGGGGTAGKAQAQPRPTRAVPELPAGPVVERPCEYRPASDPANAAAQAIARDYSKWKTFDADAALLELDNEGTTEEGNAIRVSASRGSATLNCEGYTKDREEYDLDQEIEQHMGGLKQSLAQRLKDAAGLKLEGNRLLRDGRMQEAKAAYERALAEMDLFKTASVLMSESMGHKGSALIADLHRNLAAAQLELGDYRGAKASCDAALQEAASEEAPAQEDAKARYRRALALMRLDKRAEAEEDVARLAKLKGEGDPSVQRLRSELARLRGATPAPEGAAAGGGLLSQMD